MIFIAILASDNGSAEKNDKKYSGTHMQK